MMITDLVVANAKALFLQGLEEDHVQNDITSEACILQNSKSICHLLLKEDACIAGLIFLPELINIPCEIFADEGKIYPKGTILAKLYGNTRYILGIERTLLNFLQHLCGIATYASQCKKAISPYSCDLLDTRKTLPGLRYIQKYAVAAGDGKNHRMHLEDAFMIKNNHLSFLENLTSDPVSTSITKTKNLYPEKKIIIEISDPSMIETAIAAGADHLLLDNMDPQMVKTCVEMVNKRVYTEASGNITLNNIKDYAKTGIDGISMGALTHSVRASDISLYFFAPACCNVATSS